jgi:hypothetical protein
MSQSCIKATPEKRVPSACGFSGAACRPSSMFYFLEWPKIAQRAQIEIAKKSGNQHQRG